MANKISAAAKGVATKRTSSFRYAAWLVQRRKLLSTQAKSGMAYVVSERCGHRARTRAVIRHQSDGLLLDTRRMGQQWSFRERMMHSFRGCMKQPSRGLPAAKEGMVSVCGNLGVVTDGVATDGASRICHSTKDAGFCCEYAEDGVVDVLDKRCGRRECTTNPSLGKGGTKICSTPANYGMVKVLKRCEQRHCITIPSFGKDGTKMAEFCSTYGKDGVVNVSNKCG